MVTTTVMIVVEALLLIGGALVFFGVHHEIAHRIRRWRHGGMLDLRRRR